MVVIAIIALIRVIRMAKHQRTPPPGVRRDQQSRFRTEWMPALVIYPVRASR